MIKTDNRRSYKPLIVGLILLAILQGLDLWTTLHLVNFAGNEAEANPIAAFFLDRGWLWQMKIIIVSAALAIFWTLRNSIYSTRFVWFGVLVYIAIVGWNITQIVKTP